MRPPSVSREAVDNITNAYAAKITKGIVFRDPPPLDRVRNGTYTGDAVGNFLHRIAWRAGDWAIYRTGLTREIAYEYATEYRIAYPNSEWAVRREDEGRYTLYARVLWI